ncbi:MAG TPA: beta-Ig-H3/fasciclin [Flavobacteriaceae bacterium]|nr:beta-Ig-H3/fasciclin [Flavobacteriaceae bacterium]MAY52106.1 beta-Ig-H3/fasciclin [Flavobacteriaceae bacterium]HBR53545.1 beta-Ig-H3/fasciclin [Flavobacteriaceae bacterium]|tara:strand:- start:632 stop:1228 length:597 start_codon:yes stop_codon:yes gene_type:complete
MKRLQLITSTLFAAALLMSATSFAQNGMMKKEKTVMVGGAAMYPSKNIVENAVNSKDHTTLVAAVKAAELVETLQSKGPFTVFAPTNKAFDALPEGTVETLLKPANKAALQNVLTYHVVAGKMDASAIVAAIKKGNGKAKLTTVSGGTLTATMNGNNVIVTDENGGMATVTQANVFQSNGVIHVVDTVLLPGADEKKM